MSRYRYDILSLYYIFSHIMVCNSVLPVKQSYLPYTWAPLHIPVKSHTCCTAFLLLNHTHTLASLIHTSIPNNMHTFIANKWIKLTDQDRMDMPVFKYIGFLGFKICLNSLEHSAAKHKCLWLLRPFNAARTPKKRDPYVPQTQITHQTLVHCWQL